MTEILTKTLLFDVVSLWIRIFIFSSAASTLSLGNLNASEVCKSSQNETCSEGLHLFYWKEGNFVNFGDYLSLKIVERIVGTPLKFYNKKTPNQERKLLALGSILYFANQNDVVWGSGVNGKRLNKKDYNFNDLDVRAVRGPHARAFLMDNFGIESPEIYGDPALLVPYLFPEFKKSKDPKYPYIIIPHYEDVKYFHDNTGDRIVYSTEPWDVVINKILNSEFVISSSLHGIIVAEAFGIPARMLRLSEKEGLIKFMDYYQGTGRPDFKYAASIEEALLLGGEPEFNCDVEKLYNSFPFEFWPNSEFPQINFIKDSR